MTWKNFVPLLATAARRRVVATALVYGLSMTVHFTSPAGEKSETPTPAAIMTDDGGQILHKEWRPNSAPSIAFHRDWPLGSTGYCAACEKPTQNAVHAELLFTSIETPASSFCVLARRQPQEACHGSGGRDKRTPEEI